MNNTINNKTLLTAITLTLVGIALLIAGNLISQKTQLNQNNKDTTDSSNSFSTSYPQRIICITPLGTELIYALDCQDRLIGIDMFSDYPPETQDIAKVGSFFDTNFEAVTALDPDLVISLGVSKKIQDFCDSNNIRFERLKMTNLNSLYDDILHIGAVLNCPERAIRLCQEIFNELLNVKSQVAAINIMHRQEEPVKVFLCLNRKPGTLTNIGTVGPGTCLAELIEIAGGINIFNDLSLPYADISRESLLARSPDIIIEATSALNIKDRSAELIGQWYDLDVPATANKRVFLLDENILNRPGVRSGKIAQMLFDCINAHRQ
ncbi:MAG: ABC transporter substrate-binding protein [Sedimentisphaerales bacterium]|nr:ABC transporter substrate-binding protein [Sedimentisphaerales bacterium]MBN2844000.1 ABC transporter substrate-binding protein [Sedimentisphaerales bacterium]